MKVLGVILGCLLLAIPAVNRAAMPPDAGLSTTASATMTVDNATFIDANQILMFVTNEGAFGRDVTGFIGFPYSFGTWWPYSGDTSLIRAVDSITFLSPLYNAGLWMGGIDSTTGVIRTAIAQYGTDFVPGPMEGGTYLPDDPAFKVYKLYWDSLLLAPNYDYSNWPDDQGAPVDGSGNPFMLGRQMLWTVYNDADPSGHTRIPSEPLGIEIQQTVWAGDELGEDTIYYNHALPVQHYGSSEIEVTAWVTDRDAIMKGNEYRVTFEDTIITDTIEDPVEGTIVDTLYYFAWHLDNVTTGQRLLSWQYPGRASAEVEGIRVQTTPPQPYGFANFEVVANASGVLDPSLPGALASVGFPTPGNEDPGDDQQVGDGIWLFHIADNGGTSGGGTFGVYNEFVSLATVDGALLQNMKAYDYEMRFTGSYDNPGVGGGYAMETVIDWNAFWVPFELWQTGMGTPDDPSDDVRLVPIIKDYLGDDRYGLESWGSDADGTCSGGCEHSCSDGDDDPYTDWVDWYQPADMSPGDAGYLANEAAMIGGTWDYSLVREQILYRTVLVNLNAGKLPPFGQDYPEQGTTFRITTLKPVTPADTFTFTVTSPDYYISTLEGSSLYLKYKLYNKGSNVIKDMYLGCWNDPDLGYASDDFVGCDTLNNIWFCYNADDDDSRYGSAPPTLGFKVLYGPLVPAAGETACFDGQAIPDFKNLNMTSFSRIINYSPMYTTEIYRFLQGLYAGTGAPYVYDGDTLSFQCSGDPVTGIGDIDIFPSDRQMLAASGPFDFHPGDSQFVLIKMAVGRGTSNLNSITEVKAILNEPFDPLTDVIADGPDPLPRKFSVSQNYPNPFNPTTTIQYALPERAKVTLDIYNILGQKVRRLVDESQPAGTHTVVWDGRNETNQPVATGLYFYRVRAGDLVDNKKMLLLK